MEAITITASYPGYWYENKVGQAFTCRKVTAPVAGHVHKLELFEVVDGEHEGDYILAGHTGVAQ